MEISCPKCGSQDLHVDKKGFSGKKAVVGAVLTGGIGLLAGTIGSNKLKITCLKCGNVFKPGENDPAPKELTPAAQKGAKITSIVIGSILLLLSFFAIGAQSYGVFAVLFFLGLVFVFNGTKKKPLDQKQP